MPNTFFVGKVYRHFDELPSTNDYIRNLVHDPLVPEGFSVRADFQTDGRGQMATRWVSPRGQNLLLSILLRPTWLEAAGHWWLGPTLTLPLRGGDLIGDFPFDPQMGGSSLGVPPLLGGGLTGDPSLRGGDLIGGFPFDPQMGGSSLGVPPLLGGGGLKGDLPFDSKKVNMAIKWPNDLYIGRRKVGGILIQNILSGNTIAASIIGIGLNVNQLSFGEDAPNATSLALETGHIYDLEVLTKQIFEAVERSYLRLKAGHRAAILAAYYEHLIGYGQQQTFRDNSDQSIFEGRIEGVDNHGRLHVQTRQGDRFFGIKEISFVFDS